MKDRIRLLPILALLALFLNGARAADERPSFLVFLTDDQGWGDAGCYGHPTLQTPRIDRLAGEGLRLTQCYAACSVCSPSRSAILTGRTPYRNGVWRWIPGGSRYHLRKSEITVASLLEKEGYATCHVGKWHLNGKFNSDEQPQPDDHGYDWWFATQNNAAPSHEDPRNFVRNGEPAGELEGFSAILVAEEAIDWLKNHRPADRPFFLTVWTHEPHLPIESAPRFMEPYGELEDEGLRQHHGNITQLDHALGMVLDAIDDIGARDRTFVIFTSDNGPEGNGRTGRTRGSTGGLRGRKRSTFEGGIRVPGIIRWPGRIEPGTVSDRPVIGSDIFTTVCRIAGVPVPRDRTIDGASLLPLFEGKPVRRDEPLYWRNHLAPAEHRVALRDGDWKVIGSDDLQRFELYNIAEDPRETTDVAERHPERFEDLRRRLIEHDRAVLAEGPDWWKDDRRRRPAPLGKGIDRTGDFDEVKGATVTKKNGSGGAYVLASKGEGFALFELDEPVTGRAIFELEYRSLAKGRVRNAFLALGEEPRNERLLKVGTAIGMGTHAVFRGGWDGIRRGALLSADLEKDRAFRAQVTVDIPAGTVEARIDDKTLKASLPKGTKEIEYFGYYNKGTETSFGPVSLEREP